MALKWPIMCWCAVKKLLTHSLTTAFSTRCGSLAVNHKGLLLVLLFLPVYSDSVAEWLACWTQAQKGLRSNHSRNAVG